MGFQTDVVQAREDAGLAVVRVELSDITEVPFTVQLLSQDDTATGKEEKL